MAKFGKYKVSMRKGASFMSVVMKTVRFVLLAYVGGLILIQVAPLINVSASPFNAAFTLLGITASADGSGTIGTTGLISIVGILGAVYLVMTFVQVRKA